MIRLITGTPGSGKTLFAVSEILKITQKQPEREIFTDIAGIRIEGVNDTPPDDWRDAPDGSLIIYDECHYRDQYTKKRGRNNYPMIVDLTTHRHSGKDIWLITQNPNFLHSDVLALIGEHYHVDRPLNANFANVYKWRTAQIKPDGVTVRRRAENAPVFVYDKKLFDYYDSVHVDEEYANHKSFKLPLLKVAPLVIGFLLCSIAFVRIAFGGLFADEKKVEVSSITQSDKSKAVDKAFDQAVAAKDQSTNQAMANQATTNLSIEQEVLQFELEKQRTQMLIAYQDMMLQLMQKDKELKDYKRLNELRQKTLPKDYEIITNNPDLQVRSIIKSGDNCKAYNAQGVLMALNKDECNYYLQETGRVFKQGQATNSTVAMSSNSQSHINAMAKDGRDMNE